MKVYCCQLDPAWEDAPANHRKTRALLDAAAPPAGSLVLLPEMFATGFSMNVAAISDTPEGRTRAFMAGLAGAHNLYLLGGLVSTAPDGRGHNEAVMFDPAGRQIGCYRKIHPFTFGGESEHYAAGDAPVMIDCGGVAVAPVICYDLRFPELFRATVRRGAQLFAVIANWPQPRVDHWIALLQARAIENQAYVAGVNRCGADPHLAYPGRSLIIDPRGNVLADAGAAETVIHAALDLPALEQYRREFPALADMRLLR
jgi:omega-amidase